MQKFFTLIMAALLLSGCGSTTKKLQQGNYDGVIDKTTKKLIKRADLDDALEMDRAFKLANERDIEQDQVPGHGEQSGQLRRDLFKVQHAKAEATEGSHRHTLNGGWKNLQL